MRVERESYATFRALSRERRVSFLHLVELWEHEHGPMLFAKTRNSPATRSSWKLGSAACRSQEELVATISSPDQALAEGIRTSAQGAPLAFLAKYSKFRSRVEVCYR